MQDDERERYKMFETLSGSRGERMTAYVRTNGRVCDSLWFPCIAFAIPNVKEMSENGFRSSEG